MFCFNYSQPKHSRRRAESAGIKVNAACPGFTATDLNNSEAKRTVQQAAGEPATGVARRGWSDWPLLEPFNPSNEIVNLDGCGSSKPIGHVRRKARDSWRRSSVRHPLHLRDMSTNALIWLLLFENRDNRDSMAERGIRNPRWQLNHVTTDVGVSRIDHILQSACQMTCIVFIRCLRTESSR